MDAVLPMLGQIGIAFGTSSPARADSATVFGLACAFGFLCAGPLAERVGQRTSIVAGTCSGWK